MPSNHEPTGDGSERSKPRLSNSRPRYTLAELLARSDYSQAQPPEEREWIDAPALTYEHWKGSNLLSQSAKPDYNPYPVDLVPREEVISTGRGRTQTLLSYYS